MQMKTSWATGSLASGSAVSEMTAQKHWMCGSTARISWAETIWKDTIPLFPPQSCQGRQGDLWGHTRRCPGLCHSCLWEQHISMSAWKRWEALSVLVLSYSMWAPWSHYPADCPRWSRRWAIWKTIPLFCAPCLNF